MHDDAPLQIAETHEGGWVRLALNGELDIATARRLRERLHELKEAGSDVRLDLSQLQFMDSAGAHALAEALAESRADHCDSRSSRRCPTRSAASSTWPKPLVGT
jgi:anti-anti-sigma factor